MASTPLRLFVSHSHLDNEFGVKLTQDLRRVLADESAVFYDVMGGLHGGEIWWEKILEELTTREVLLLILSPDAMNSVWVRREINIALNKNKLILPLHYRTCTIRADLEILQVISFLAPRVYEEAFRDVLVALNLPLETPIIPEQRTTSTDSQHAPSPAARLTRQIQTAFTDHDWSDVIRKADYLNKHMPESMTALVYRWQGVALVEEGEDEQAQEAFQTALALVSDRQERLTLLSDYTALLVRQQQWTKVLQRSREALRLAPQDAAWQAMQQLAQQHLALSMPPTKLERFEERPTPVRDLKTLQWWLEKGNTLRYNRQFDDALKAYENAIRLDPTSVYAYNGKGYVLHELKRCEEALSAYEQAIRLDPNNAYAYKGKGYVLYELKRYEEALSAYKEAIHLDPTSTLAYNDKGNALRKLQRYEEALKVYEQVIHLNPSDAIAYNGKGHVLLELRRYEEALRTYEQAIRLDPALALAYYNTGIILEHLGRWSEAQNFYDKARQLGYQG